MYIKNKKKIARAVTPLLMALVALGINVPAKADGSTKAAPSTTHFVTNDGQIKMTPKYQMNRFEKAVAIATSFNKALDSSWFAKRLQDFPEKDKIMQICKVVDEAKTGYVSNEETVKRLRALLPPVSNRDFWTRLAAFLKNDANSTGPIFDMVRRTYLAVQDRIMDAPLIDLRDPETDLTAARNQILHGNSTWVLHPGDPFIVVNLIEVQSRDPEYRFPHLNVSSHWNDFMKELLITNAPGPEHSIWQSMWILQVTPRTTGDLQTFLLERRSTDTAKVLPVLILPGKDCPNLELPALAD